MLKIKRDDEVIILAGKDKGKRGKVRKVLANNKVIARELHLTEGTVKGYVSAILAKLDVSDRTQAALYAVKHGMDNDA